MTRDLPGTELDCPHLTERELAARWRVSLRTVQRWRRKGVAPPHLLLGRAPIFPLTAASRIRSRASRGRAVMHVIAGSAQAIVTADLATIRSYVQLVLADLRGL